MRHAKTPYGDDIFVSTTDFSLSREGIKQAREIGRELRGERIDAIYCSMLKRSVQTAEEIGKILKIKPEKHRELNEVRFGIFEGLKKEEAKAKYPEVYKKRESDAWNFRIPGGESYREAAERAGRFIKKLIRKHPKGTLLFVIHAGLIKALLKYLLDMDMKEVTRLGYTNGCMIFLKNENNRIELIEMRGVIRA